MADEKTSGGRSEAPADPTTRAASGGAEREQTRPASQEPAPHGQNARAQRARERGDAEPVGSGDAEQVTTMVCIACGAEQFFTERVPAALTCETCQGSVFRTYQTPVERDEAAISGMEERARSISYGDASPQTAQDELRDLGR